MSEEKPTNLDSLDEPLICFCYGVTEATIRAAIKAGARTVQEIRDATQANTGCQGCLSEVERILTEEGFPQPAE